ncbi:DUF1190 domain-containing protein [Agrobacterium vitis]|uniref:DUF1190 domain-containing protein n=1 Tax=Agrobacterium vitis TaxID=373 RepID=A0ABD6G8Q1_AGRVI|nr:DUF1190 domain-containing protein [Agrobacterium vitis]MUO80616.1 DUF1190 domain-containing protein [Agrobacterium vitis]MUO94982.1 DUF1190 domain-containing protein [Agrobacterium vitis]MUP05226.1 DUF1190 domain-containing protein [Agrobacterium vitis]MUZ81971.1 DUF1190 domain-containing protein [Agrobacterium vitis]MVA09704.1 DUF1190 domain-containing protein [Agrobacterium vitis]
MRRRLSGRTPPILALGTIAASSLLLSGCGEDAPTERTFTSVDQCISQGMDREVCQTAYQDAVKTHMANAPRFDGMAACEAEYGAKQCVQQTAPNTGGTGSGSFFMPFMAGYLLSSTINNIGDYYRYQREATQGSSYGGGGSTPIYRNRSGQTVTINKGRDTILAPSSSKPANVNTRTVSRQGFGGRSSFSFGG